MPELRRDPITRRWTIIATERAWRPSDFLKNQGRAHDQQGRLSPFAEGNEHLTPQEILAHRPHGGEANGPGWTSRVIPNKFPALAVEGTLEKQADGLYDRMHGVGAHEVIIESPDPTFKLQELPPDHLTRVLGIYRDRMADLANDMRLRFSLVFRNQGAAAGASVAHGHAQLIALPVVPVQVQELLDGAKSYYDFRERNVFDDIINQEVDDGRRVVHDNGDFVLMAPYASRSPFELWIVPRKHETRFDRTDDHQLGRLAEVLTLALKRLEIGLGDPAYNFMIQSAPYDLGDVPWYRWHVVILPKLTAKAGFEWGTGFYINPTAPEEAAAFLREVDA